MLWAEPERAVRALEASTLALGHGRHQGRWGSYRCVQAPWGLCRDWIFSCVSREHLHTKCRNSAKAKGRL